MSQSLEISYESALGSYVNTKDARMLVQEEIVRIEGLWETGTARQVRLKAELFDIMRNSVILLKDLLDDPIFVWEKLSHKAKSAVDLVPLVAHSMTACTVDDHIGRFVDMDITSISEVCQIPSYLKGRGIISQKEVDKVCKYMLKYKNTFTWQVDCIAWLCHVMTPAKFAARVPPSWLDNRGAKISMPKDLYKVCKEGRNKK